MGNEKSHLVKPEEELPLTSPNDQLYEAFDHRESEKLVEIECPIFATLSENDPNLNGTLMDDSQNNLAVTRCVSFSETSGPQESIVEPSCGTSKTAKNESLENSAYHPGNREASIQQLGASQDLMAYHEHWAGLELETIDTLRLGKTFPQLLKSTEPMDSSSASFPVNEVMQMDNTFAQLQEPKDTTPNTWSVSVYTNNENMDNNKSFEEILAQKYPKISTSIWTSFKKLKMPLKSLLPMSNITYNLDCIKTVHLPSRTSSNYNQSVEDYTLAPFIDFKGGAVLYEDMNCGVPASEMNQTIQQSSESTGKLQMERGKNVQFRIPSVASTIISDSAARYPDESDLDNLQFTKHSTKRSFRNDLEDYNLLNYPSLLKRSKRSKSTLIN